MDEVTRQIFMTSVMPILDRVHTLAVFRQDLAPDSISLLRRERAMKTFFQYRYKCPHCTELHLGVFTKMFNYEDRRPGIFDDATCEGGVIVCGYQRLSYMVPGIFGSGEAGVYLIAADGELRGITDPKAIETMRSATPLTEDQKMAIILEGATPEHAGRTSWDD